MKTVAEYRSYAAECRNLAMRRPEDKEALESIAQAWDKIADEREGKLIKQR
jgi:hypothetical protein